MKDLQAANDALLSAFQAALRALYMNAAKSDPGPERLAFEQAAEIVGDAFEEALSNPPSPPTCSGGWRG